MKASFDAHTDTPRKEARAQSITVSRVSGHQRNLEAAVTFSPLFSAICLSRKRFKTIMSAFLPAVLDKLALSTIEVNKKKRSMKITFCFITDILLGEDRA